MVIIARSAITQFSRIYPDAGDSLLQWYIRTTESEWKSFLEIKKNFQFG